MLCIKRAETTTGLPEIVNAAECNAQPDDYKYPARPRPVLSKRERRHQNETRHTNADPDDPEDTNPIDRDALLN